MTETKQPAKQETKQPAKVHGNTPKKITKLKQGKRIDF